MSAPVAVNVLSQLSAKWRSEAEQFGRRHSKQNGYETDWSDEAKSSTLDRVADELDEASAAVAELVRTANKVWIRGGAVSGGEWDELGNALARCGGAQ